VSNLDDLVAATKAELAVWGQRRAEGLDTLSWRLGVQQTLKNAHVTSAALARGGWDQMDASTRGFVGSRLRQQYSYLSVLGLDTAPGDFGPQAMQRLSMYGGAVRGTYSGVIRRDAPEDAMEQNVLSESAASCDECQELTDRGPVPVGTLPEVGSRT
jgi:hypothetical protein